MRGTSTDTGHGNKCEYCDKKGIPIMPLRYAVAPVFSGTPQITGLPVALPADVAYYTRRLLRSGYLYVYDESAEMWTDYYVSEEGYYFKMPPDDPLKPFTPPKNPPCNETGHREIASCITVRKSARNVWLGFSDVQWTKAVRDRHTSGSELRKQHMRCVNISDITASPEKQHILGLQELHKHVAEYALGKEAAGIPNFIKTLHEGWRTLYDTAWFAWSPFRYVSRKATTEQLQRTIESLAPGKGIAVVLNDPVGIAAEIGALMELHMQGFTGIEKNKRTIALGSTLASIEEMVREQAMDGAQDTIDKQIENARQAPGNFGASIFSEGEIQRQEAAARDIKPERLEQISDETWAKYTAKLNPKAMKKSQDEYDAALKAFDAKYIAPLATAHSLLMQCEAMASSFQCNFDTANVESGAMYTHTVQLCIGSTQDKKASFDLYEKWLNGSVGDKKNLLLRALVLNNDELAQNIKAAAEAASVGAISIDKRGLPWDQLIGAFNGLVKTNHTDMVAGALGNLVVSVGGSITKFFMNDMKGKLNQAVITLGVISRSPIVPIQIVGTADDFKRATTAMLADILGDRVSPRSLALLEAKVEQRIKRLQITGVNKTGTHKLDFLAMLDLGELDNSMTGANSVLSRMDALVNSIHRPPDIKKLKMGKWRTKLADLKLSGKLKGGLGFVAGAIAAFIQYQAYCKLSEDEAKGNVMTHEKTEATTRKWAGLGAVIGTVSEQVGEALALLSKVVPKSGGKLLVRVSTWLTVGGKALGLAGGLVMAAFDFWQAYANYKDKNYVTTGLYLLSGGLGVAIGIWFFAFNLTPGILGLIVLLMIVAVLIEYFKDNRIQEWLKCCMWGINPTFRTHAEEMDELNKAVTPG